MSHSLAMSKVNIANPEAASRPEPGRLSSPEPSMPVSTSFGFALFCGSLAGMLSWLCHFPMALGWLGWIALVPLLYLIRMPGTWRRVYGCTLVAGILFYLPALQWLRVADPRMYWTWIGLSVYCASLLLVKVFLVRCLEQNTFVPLLVTVPVVWVAVDYWQAHFGTGFPWYFLGYSQHDALPIIQVADLAGVYGVTMLVALVNVWGFNLLNALRIVREYTLAALAPRPRKPWMLVAESAVVIASIGGTLEYGYFRLAQTESTPGPLVSLIQGDVDQRIKNEASADDGAAAKFVLDHYDQLTEAAVRQTPEPDMVIWPETSFPDEWVEAPAGTYSPSTRQLIDWVKNRWQTNVLLGINCHEEGVDGSVRGRYNSAFLIMQNGKIAERYDKIHRVPFGEYVPFRDWLPFMNRLAPYDFDYSIQSGARLTRFPFGAVKFGVLICYEDTDPSLARRYVDRHDGLPPADFLVNMSNDGWFLGTSEHEEHLAISRFRAIESRRAVVRSVNMGISAIIDANGRVLKPEDSTVDKNVHLWRLAATHERPSRLPINQWSDFKRVAGVVTGRVPLDRRTSYFARFGSWLPETCWALILAGLIWPWTRPRRRMRASAAR